MCYAAAPITNPISVGAGSASSRSRCMDNIRINRCSMFPSIRFGEVDLKQRKRDSRDIWSLHLSGIPNLYRRNGS